MDREQAYAKMQARGYVSCTESEARAAREAGRAFGVAWAYRWTCPRDDHFEWYTDESINTLRGFPQMVGGASGCKTLHDFMDRWEPGRLGMFDWFAVPAAA
ncbi:hypothetical protein [Myxococcus stipitatus]|nr:hypothetical protein [Myxococcus stipitatus]